MAAPAGTLSDAVINKFKEDFKHQVQQTRSEFSHIPIDTELGDKTYFDIIGKLDAVPKTQRLQVRVPQGIAMQRRYFAKDEYENSVGLDSGDASRIARNLKPDLIKALAAGIIRYRDNRFVTALTGNAAVQENGTITSTAVPAGQKVAVNFHGYATTSYTSDVGLTWEKVAKAKSIIESAYANPNQGPLHLVGKADQMNRMLASAQLQIQAGGGTPTGLAPRAADDMESLEKFLNVKIHKLESIPVDAAADDQVVLYTEDALMAGANRLAEALLHQSAGHMGSPWIAAIYEDFGVVRTFEEKVVVIACDPNLSVNS